MTEMTETRGTMFKTIVLITGEVEQPVLGDLFRQHNPALEICPVVSAKDLAGLDPALWPTARIIGFCTDVLVPAAVIAATGWGAYNFHPGSPDYPGWAPFAFAAYRGASRFGATAHEMAARVDSGAIIDVELFDVPGGCEPDQLMELSYSALFRLFLRLAEPLATSAAALPNCGIAWGTERCSRRALAKLCDIPANIAADDLARRIRAFAAVDESIRPTVTLHGHRFRLE